MKTATVKQLCTTLVVLWALVLFEAPSGRVLKISPYYWKKTMCQTEADAWNNKLGGGHYVKCMKTNVNQPYEAP